MSIFKNDDLSMNKPTSLIELNKSVNLTIENFEDTSIENIILSLNVEPNSRMIFKEMVTNARERFGENQNKYFNPDELYIGSDGLREFNTFYLNRKRKILRVEFSVENAIPPYKGEYYLHFINDSWIQSESLLKEIEINRVIETTRKLDLWQGVGG